MALHLSGKVVALHLDNSTAKAYLFKQGGTVSPFLSRLACQILSLTSKCGITLIPAYIPTHLNVEADYLSWDQMLPEWYLLPWVDQAAFHLMGLPDVGLLASYHSTQCQHYYTLESPLPLGAMELNAFEHPWTFQISHVFVPSALVPLVLSTFLAEYVKGQLRHLILVAPCWAISTFLEPHHLHEASNHPVISILMHHFYLQHHPFHKHFDPWDVEQFLSLLESWAPASSLTTFKLAWKTATLLALVTMKHSDLTLLCIDG